MATKAALRKEILEAKETKELLEKMAKMEDGEGSPEARKMVKMEELSEYQIKKIMAMPWPPAMPVKMPECPYDELEEDVVKLVKNLRNACDEFAKDLLFYHVEIARIRLQVLEKKMLEVEAMEKGILEEGGQ
ncbi:hypothetical protein ACP70R_044021 [Stipagrostis hirtigluma subsp. patula]